MAKLLSFLAVLVVASAILAEAHSLGPPPPETAPPPLETAPAPAPHPIGKTPSKFNLKAIIYNKATIDVKFKLVIEGKIAGRVVVAKPGKWTAIGPVKVECKVPVVHVWVSVKTYNGVVKKTFPVTLSKVLKHIFPGTRKWFTLTAFEAKSYKGKKVLVVKLNKEVQAVIKL